MGFKGRALYLCKTKHMKLVVQILISALAVMVTQWILPGVEVDSYYTGIWVAIILGLLNSFLKPILVLLTLPITVFTLGLFLLVINAFVIELAANLIDGFAVSGFWWAVLFSFILSAVTSVFNSVDEKNG